MAPGVALSWQMWVRWRLLANVVLHIRNLEGEMIRELWVQPQQLQRGQRESHLANSRLTVELKSTQTAPSIPRSRSRQLSGGSRGKQGAGTSRWVSEEHVPNFFSPGDKEQQENPGGELNRLPPTLLDASARLHVKVTEDRLTGDQSYLI